MLICGQAISQTYSSTSSVTITPSGVCPGTGANFNSVINVSDSGYIAMPSNVFINTNLQINCSAAFKLVLVAPNGDSCILLNLPYRTGPCSGTCYTSTSTNTLSFNSTHTNPYPIASPAPTGNYAPTASSYAPQVGNLNTFLMGKSINGNWTLAARGDAGYSATIASWSIVFGSTALPLDLTSFYGYAYSGYNELKWSTASEKNTASFDVQLSLDEGKTFETVGTVSANGYGNNVYSFQDDRYAAGVNLYRLRMIDRDGTYSYSKNNVKITGKSETGGSIAFSPNPVKDLFNLAISNKDLLNSNAKIINSLGQTVYSFRIEQEKMQYSLGQLAGGIYFLQLANGDHYRFVKEN